MNLFTPDNKLGETGLVDKVQLIHTLILFVVLLLVDWLLPIYFSAPLQVAVIYHEVQFREEYKIKSL